MNARGLRSSPALLTLLMLSAATSAQSQSSAPAAPRPVPRSSDEALLGEVRLIRETLQRAQGAAQREHMLVERIRTHDQRVERLDRHLTEVRDEIGGIEVHVRQVAERARSLDAQAQRASDPAQRRALETEATEMTFTQEAQRQRLDRLRERESEISVAMNREERTLRNLEGRLEALDREIEAEARRGQAPNPLGKR